MVEEVTKEEIAHNSIDTSVEADEAETQVYEVGFHIVSSVEERNIAGEMETIKSIIEKNGGVFISEEFPKKIKLAYTISKNIGGKRERFDTAYFGWVKFEMKTDSIINLKEVLDANKNVLRFLIIKTVKESTLLPKSVVSPKAEVTKSVKPMLIGKQKKSKEFMKEENKKPLSEEELDKTIEELIVD